MMGSATAPPMQVCTAPEPCSVSGRPLVVMMCCVSDYTNILNRPEMRCLRRDVDGGRLSPHPG